MPNASDPLNCTFRAALPSDLPAIAALQTATWRQAYAGLLPDAYLDGPMAQDLTDRWQPAIFERLRVTVATAPTLLGFVSVAPGGPKGAYLDNLHVAPRAQGLGVGRQLLVKALETALDHGDARLWLTVITGNTQARRFYAGCGGIESAPFTEELYGNAVDVVAVHWDDLTPMSVSAIADGANRRAGAAG